MSDKKISKYIIDTKIIINIGNKFHCLCEDYSESRTSLMCKTVIVKLKKKLSKESNIKCILMFSHINY